MPTARKPRRRPKTPKPGQGLPVGAFFYKDPATPTAPSSRKDLAVALLLVWAIVATGAAGITYYNMSGQLARAEAAYVESVAQVQAHWHEAYQRLLAKLKESGIPQRPGEGGSSL